MINRYLSSRFPPCVFIPLVLLISMGWKETFILNFSVNIIILRLLITCGLLFSFRLLDDLFSRTEDAHKDPARITVPPDNLHFFKLTLIISFTITTGLAIFSLSTNTVLILTISYVVFLTLYLFKKPAPRPLFDFLVLLKYPVFTFIITNTVTVAPEYFTRLLLMYCVIVIYEVFHDETHRKSEYYSVTGYFFWTIFLFLHFLIFHQSIWFYPTIIISSAFFISGLLFSPIRKWSVFYFVNGAIWVTATILEWVME